MDVHLLSDCIYYLRISYSGYLFMFGVLRTCSPNTRDSAGFAGFSLRVCAVTRVGWVGGISLGALCALRNFLANSLETIWRKFFCFHEILETSFYCFCKFSVTSVET